VSNMNGITRKKLYQLLVKRDGEYCKCCGKLPHEASLVIDHRDNNNNNNTLTNLQILCRTCNFIKNPRNRPLDLCVNNKSNSDNESCIAINRKKEPLFKEFICNEIDRKDAVNLNEIINDAAAKVDISQVTAKRYLDKLTANEGELMLVDLRGETLVAFSQYHDFGNSMDFRKEL